jgi:hypothetical protein
MGAPAEHARDVDAQPLTETERALDALEAEGARLFDAASCDCVRTLITRAEELGGRAGTLLGARAADHVARLGGRFRRMREEATQRLVAQGERATPKLERALARGDVVPVRRALRRHARLPRPIEAHRVPARRQIMGTYDDALAELVAAFALARADESVPEDAGPYNPLRIASDLLSRMRAVSPLYLTAQLNRLEELASLLTLPELPAEPSRTLPRKKRKALKRSS